MNFHVYFFLSIAILAALSGIYYIYDLFRKYKIPNKVKTKILYDSRSEHPEDYASSDFYVDPCENKNCLKIAIEMKKCMKENTYGFKK